VHHASATYRGDGKTDTKDAAIIADQARMRRDLQPVRGGDQISVDLRIMSARRTDLTCDRSVRSTASARHCWNTSRHWSGRSTIPRTKPRSPSQRPTRRLTRCAGSASPGSGPGWRPGAAATAPASPKAIDAANGQHTTLPTQRLGSVMVTKLAAPEHLPHARWGNRLPSFLPA
jgi:hypothetical protein